MELEIQVKRKKRIEGEIVPGKINVGGSAHAV
jgi:hypothetical protein